MEGPTPVSALLHAATMVTAGVYLVIRFSFIIEYSGFAKGVVFFGGFFTVIFSSLVALAQYDIKKIIAYSTCSQLGVMFFACGLSAYNLALYHFFNHAFFKCLLFLLAGAIIHQLHNEQDIRKMGGLFHKMPATFACFLIASFSLAGFPSMSGATSKDLILLLSNYMAVNAENKIFAVILLSSNAMIYLTVAYSARLLFYVFIKPSSRTPSELADLENKTHNDPVLSEKPYAAIFSFLSAMSVIGGGLFKDYFVSSGQFHYVDIRQDIIVLNPHVELCASATLYLFPPFMLTLNAFGTAYCAIMFAQIQGGV